MARYVRLLGVAAIACAVLSGCGYGSESSPFRLPTGASPPPPPTQPSPQPSPQPPPALPPMTGPSTTYLFSGPLSYPVTGATSQSKFVLYDNGAFSFQYVSLAASLSGTYRQENGRISFDFAPLGGEDASGALNGDLLEVRFSDRMQHSDFENAVYKRSQ